LLLLLAVPALSTLAKQSWYLPPADTCHYLNGAIKMQVDHPGLLADSKPLLPAAKVVQPKPEGLMLQPVRPEPEIPRIALTASVPLRSPPAPRLA
jgi:hypothetical protein